MSAAGAEVDRNDEQAFAESPVAEGLRSLEVRWIFPGRLEPAVAEWFGRFPAETESRKDIYLLRPDLRGLSVKVRDGKVLDVKVYRGSPGILGVADRVRGRLQIWQKWSFPFSPLSHKSGDPPGWGPVHKTRRISRFSVAGGLMGAGGPGLAEGCMCAVELTQVHALGEDSWSLGFEATGPADQLRGELETAAARVFAHPVPGGVELGTDASRSYAEWLSANPAANPGSV